MMLSLLCFRASSWTVASKECLSDKPVKAIVLARRPVLRIEAFSSQSGTISHEASADTLTAANQSTAVGTSPKDIDTGDFSMSIAPLIAIVDPPHSTIVCDAAGHTDGHVVSLVMSTLVMVSESAANAVSRSFSCISFACTESLPLR